MPLPAALAARLAKRGLIQPKGKSTAASIAVHPPGYVEEVIAEDYDDPVLTPMPTPTPVAAAVLTSKTNTTPSITNFHRLGHLGCPNKCSIYHTCSKYCVVKWGRGKTTPDPKYNARRLKMLRKYPLPKGWVEIYDAGCAHYYYWKTDTDEVSWRSPRHPKAVLSRAAAELRAELIQKQKETIAMPPPATPRGREERKMTVDPRKHDRKRRHREVDELDPMDPAAYSDIPRGDWSAGLDKHTDAQTGADTTAAGPLFQMRPYPSPGAIMRANAESKPKKDKD